MALSYGLVLAQPQPGPETVHQWVYSPDVDPSSEAFDTLPVPEGKPDTMVAAINRTMKDEMARDPRIVVFGEDVADASDRSGLFSLVDQLDPRSADVIRRRYGLHDGRQAVRTRVVHRDRPPGGQALAAGLLFVAFALRVLHAVGAVAERGAARDADGPRRVDLVRLRRHRRALSATPADGVGTSLGAQCWVTITYETSTGSATSGPASRRLPQPRSAIVRARGACWFTRR